MFNKPQIIAINLFKITKNLDFVIHLSYVVKEVTRVQLVNAVY